MAYSCWLECIRGCGKKHSIFDAVYRCEDCGGLLDVQHDLQALQETSPQDWKSLFERRTRSNEWPFGSGVWGKKEWVCPPIKNENVVSFYEGHSNCFWAERLGVEIGVPDLWVKLSGNSHTGSFKDLGMTVLVSAVRQMLAEGAAVRAVVCASTGDTSAALAAYAAAAGIPAVILLPSGKVSTAQLVQPIANHAHVLSLDTDFDGCMRIVQELSKDPTIYLANSMNALRMEGQKTVGIEIVQQFDWEVPDWIILPVGNLGNVSAIAKGLLMMKSLGLISRLPRIACAQAANADPLYQSSLQDFEAYVPVQAKTTLASAIQIGDPVSYERAVPVLEGFDGVVERASEQELADAAAKADRTGMYACPHTGVALAVLFKLVDRGEISSTDRVVVISTAHGLKFTDFKVGYHNKTLEEVTPRYSNPPHKLDADITIVSEMIDQLVEHL
ncbi:MAG: threonine synthase [Anaerolineales bacterium]|nr:threonine synthase [Anaerolineales bacterium]